MKFKTIIGGTEAEALVKFHWLAEADFEDAVIDITYNYLVWKNGVWEYGTWENGFWRGGRMWSNANQIYEIVEYKDGKFTVIS